MPRRGLGERRRRGERDRRLGDRDRGDRDRGDRGDRGDRNRGDRDRGDRDRDRKRDRSRSRSRDHRDRGRDRKRPSRSDSSPSKADKRADAPAPVPAPVPAEEADISLKSSSGPLLDAAFKTVEETYGLCRDDLDLDVKRDLLRVLDDEISGGIIRSLFNTLQERELQDPLAWLREQISFAKRAHKRT